MSNEAPTDALRLVPVEPTEAMVADGVKAAQRAEQTCVSWPEMALFTYRAMLAAAPASPLPGGGLPGRPVHIVRVRGATLEEQKDAVRRSETYKRGDTVLAWVNEGDLYANPFVRFEELPAAPTGEK